jgi:protocatechuate 3,4-dioxygenase beta subunit
MVTAPGFERLITHVFRSDDVYLDSDSVFGVRQSLVADWVKQPDGTYLLEYDFILNPEPTHASQQQRTTARVGAIHSRPGASVA